MEELVQPDFYENVCGISLCSLEGKKKKYYSSNRDLILILILDPNIDIIHKQIHVQIIRISIIIIAVVIIIIIF